jgi:hypothetical protein
MRSRLTKRGLTKRRLTKRRFTKRRLTKRRFTKRRLTKRIKKVSNKKRIRKSKVLKYKYGGMLSEDAVSVKNPYKLAVLCANKISSSNEKWKTIITDFNLIDTKDVKYYGKDMDVPTNIEDVTDGGFDIVLDEFCPFFNDIHANAYFESFCLNNIKIGGYLIIYPVKFDKLSEIFKENFNEVLQDEVGIILNALPCYSGNVFKIYKRVK